MKGRVRTVLIPTAAGLIAWSRRPRPRRRGTRSRWTRRPHSPDTTSASTRRSTRRRTARGRRARPGRAHLFPCQEAPDGRCGRVKVPLDRAHPSRGTIPIFFEYFRHRAPGPTKRAILTTEGGPGGSITQGSSIGPLFLDAFGPLLRSRDLILLDQRGVGRSGAIDCEQVQHDFDWGSPRIYGNVRACGRQLGSAASLYGSGDVALGHQRGTARAGDQKAGPLRPLLRGGGRPVLCGAVPAPRALGRTRLPDGDRGPQRPRFGVRRLSHGHCPHGSAGGGSALRPLGELLGGTANGARRPGVARPQAAAPGARGDRLRRPGNPAPGSRHRGLPRLDHPPGPGLQLHLAERDRGSGRRATGRRSGAAAAAGGRRATPPTPPTPTGETRPPSRRATTSRAPAPTSIFRGTRTPRSRPGGGSGRRHETNSPRVSSGSSPWRAGWPGRPAAQPPIRASPGPLPGAGCRRRSRRARSFPGAYPRWCWPATWISASRDRRPTQSR